LRVVAQVDIVRAQTLSGKNFKLWEFLFGEVHVGDVVDLRIQERNHFFRTHRVDHESEFSDAVKVRAARWSLRNRGNQRCLQQAIDVEDEILEQLRQLRLLCVGNTSIGTAKYLESHFKLGLNRLEVVLIHLQSSHGAACPEQSQSTCVDVFKWQVLDVRERYSCVVDSDASLAVRGGVEKSTLNKEVFLILHQSLLFSCVLSSPLNFIDYDPVLVNHWTQNQICSLLFD